MRANRRQTIAGLAAAIAATAGPPLRAAPQGADMRTIPSSGERIPVIGLGTWITFNVGGDPALRAQSTDVMRVFFEDGGGMIDSSPMHGSAQATVGAGLAQLGDACRSHSVCARLDRVASGAGPARMVRHQHRHAADARRGRWTAAATLALGLVFEAEVAGDRHALRAPFRGMPAQILLRIERVLAKLIGGLPGPSRIEQHGAGEGDHIGLA